MYSGTGAGNSQATNTGSVVVPGDYDHTVDHHWETCIVAGPNACLYVESDFAARTTLQQDLVGGVIAVRLSWDLEPSGYAGSPAASFGQGINSTYEFDQPYAFTLRVSATQSLLQTRPYSLVIGTSAGRTLFQQSGVAGPLEFFTSGVLTPGAGSDLYVGASVYGCSTNGGCSAAGALTGDLRYELTLTPVPVPAALWFMMSGLGGALTLVRRRKPLAV